MLTYTVLPGKFLRWNAGLRELKMGTFTFCVSTDLRAAYKTHV
jgi:hypothetical protein